MAVTEVFGQGGSDVRFDWGPTGASRLHADVAVIVDVLSFSTSATIAVERGMRVFPYPWKDARAAEFAASHDAVLAVGRLESTKAGAVVAPSLSPAGLLECAVEPRIVLPSPNGSTIAALVADAGSTVTIGCLRNAGAVACWLSRRLDEGCSVAVIAAGERWGSDDSLRPALEDQLGAGAILSALLGGGYGDRFSAESTACAVLFDGVAPRLVDTVRACVSGQELASAGCPADVEVAAALDASSVVPVLTDGSFTASMEE